MLSWAPCPPREGSAEPSPQDHLVNGAIGRTREILFGGAKGGGKSEAVAPFVLTHAARWPGCARVLVLRETFDELRDLRDRGEPLYLAVGARWVKSEWTWYLPDGSTVRYGHLQRGYAPYWGQEYTLIVIDELTRCMPSESEYLKLLGSLRSSRGVACQVLCLSNPGGPGHNWVKARFMGVPPRTVQCDKAGLERVYLPASLADNPNLPPEYRATLEQYGEAERRAYLDGDWDAFEGSVFKLEAGVHVWTWAQFNAFYGLPADNRRPPADWPRFRVFDHGFAKPFAVLWLAVGPGGRAVAYREWYGVAKDAHGEIEPNVGVRLEARAIAQGIADRELDAGEMERDDEGRWRSTVTGWTGRDLFDTGRGDHGAAKPMYEDFTPFGVYFTPWASGPGSRVPAKQAVHQRLAYERHEDGTIAEYPGLIIIGEACPHLLRTLPALSYDETRPEDVDTNGEDHLYDALKGFCVMRPYGPQLDQPEQRDWWQEFQEAQAAQSGGGWL